MIVKTPKDNLAVGDTVSVVSGSYGTLYRVTYIRERIDEKRRVGLRQLTQPMNLWSFPT